MPSIDPYNPLDLEALGDSLVRQLERQPAVQIDKIDRFDGAGIYSLYFCGSSGIYRDLGVFNSQKGCRIPIYVGRAKDPGARRGLDPLQKVERPLLFNRVREHKKSIAAVSNLDVEDFYVRTLVVMPIWVPLAETMMIRRYRPLWNQHITGFGIHHPGGGRIGQETSDWDKLHPGRKFAKTLKQKRAVPADRLEQLKQMIDQAISEFQ